jgi:hypothetical protein
MGSGKGLCGSGRVPPLELWWPRERLKCFTLGSEKQKKILGNGLRNNSNNNGERSFQGKGAKVESHLKN